MIDLSNRDLKNLALDFFNKIKGPLERRLGKHKATLATFETDRSHISLDQYLSSNMELIITGDLEKLSGTFNPELKNLFQIHYKRNIQFKAAINNIFFYENYALWGAYELAEKLGISTCPYCNRNYISPIGTDKSNFYRGDYDHFLSKSEFPYLRLSFFNLIPSCIICNQRSKRNQTTNLNNYIYPYKEGFGNDATFSFIPESYRQIIGQDKPYIYLRILDSNSSKGKKIKNNIKLFKLNQQYSIHHQELNSVLAFKKKSSNTYIKGALKLLSGAFTSEKEAYEFLFRNYHSQEEYEKQPLAKFTKEISDEIGINIYLGK